MADLNDLYLETINEQRFHLTQLQSQFNEISDRLTHEAEQQIKNLLPNDVEGKQVILQKLKSSIGEELQKLKDRTHESQSKTLNKLEELNAQRESLLLNNLDDLIEGA